MERVIVVAHASHERWPDDMTDDQILERLLALNVSRSPRHSSRRSDADHAVPRSLVDHHIVVGRWQNRPQGTPVAQLLPLFTREIGEEVD